MPDRRNPGSAWPPGRLRQPPRLTDRRAGWMRRTRTWAAIRTRSRPAPTRAYPPFGAFGAVMPDIHSPRTQSWNASVERQIGTDWGVSASYLGSYSDRLWGLVALEPRGCTWGPGPCVINWRLVSGVHDDGEPEQPAAAVPENPRKASTSPISTCSFDVGSQRLPRPEDLVQRRSAAGVSLNGNYTLSRCIGLDWANTGGNAGGYTNPDDPDADRGHCDADRTHIANVTAGVADAGIRRAPALSALASQLACSRASSTRGRAAG